MKKLLVIGLSGVVLALFGPATESAIARLQYCSPSGDLCYGVVQGPPLRLRIGLFARYLAHYRLCVTGPDRQTDCRRFRVHHAKGGTYESVVTWSRHFPDRGHGVYRARWRAAGRVLGPAVAFKRRSAHPSISVFPRLVRPGRQVRVYGSAGGCPLGDLVTLISEAFPPTHEFAGVPAVFTAVHPGSLYGVAVRIPADRTPGAYTISGRCGGGNLGVSATLRVLAR